MLWSTDCKSPWCPASSGFGDVGYLLEFLARGAGVDGTRFTRASDPASVTVQVTVCGCFGNHLVLVGVLVGLCWCQPSTSCFTLVGVITFSSPSSLDAHLQLNLLACLQLPLYTGLRQVSCRLRDIAGFFSWTLRSIYLIFGGRFSSP